MHILNTSLGVPEVGLLVEKLIFISYFLHIAQRSRKEYTILFFGQGLQAMNSYQAFIIFVNLTGVNVFQVNFHVF